MTATIFASVGSKGGVGKSTFAVNLVSAIRYAEPNAKVGLVDMDKIQGHSMAWVALREDSIRNGADLPHIDIMQAVSDEQGSSPGPIVQSYARRFDFLVLDCGGRIGPELRAALRLAHVSFTPFQPSQFDLWTIRDMLPEIRIAREYNPNLISVVYVNAADTNVKNPEAREGRDYLLTYKEHVHVAETIVYDRKAYRSVIKTGRAINEQDDPKAISETFALIEEGKALLQGAA